MRGNALDLKPLISQPSPYGILVTERRYGRVTIRLLLYQFCLLIPSIEHFSYIMGEGARFFLRQVFRSLVHKLIF